jgi:hypothetical protein
MHFHISTMARRPAAGTSPGDAPAEAVGNTYTPPLSSPNRKFKLLKVMDII